MTTVAPADAADASLGANVARREQTRELGATLVLSVFRLLKTAQVHALDNMAVLQQLEQTTETVRLFASKTSSRVSILFAKNTVFVGGQLLLTPSQLQRLFRNLLRLAFQLRLRLRDPLGLRIEQIPLAGQIVRRLFEFGKAASLQFETLQRRSEF